MAGTNLMLKLPSWTQCAGLQTPPRFRAIEKEIGETMPSIGAAEANNPAVITVASGNPRTDEELVAAAKNGDELAFEVLIKRYESRIFSIARHYTRVHEDAEDIVQQSLQKAFVHLQNFQGKSSFSTWLTRIAINESLMFLRKGRALREIPINETHSEEGTYELEIRDSRPDPELRYLQLESASMLSAAIAQLRPGTRAAMELSELRELSGAETARQIGVSLSAIKARVFHGRRELREILRRSAGASRRPGHTILSVGGNCSAGRKCA
jgi:RNA polymerase sigma-70 factor (ECF subfamily)